MEEGRPRGQCGDSRADLLLYLLADDDPYSYASEQGARGQLVHWLANIKSFSLWVARAHYGSISTY